MGVGDYPQETRGGLNFKQLKFKLPQIDGVQENNGREKLFLDGREIERVTNFKYLGRYLNKLDDDTEAVRAQIK